MKFKIFAQVLLSVVLTLSACQISPTGQLTPGSTPFSAKTTDKQGPYTGPVSLKIDTGLMKKISGKIVNLSHDGKDFQIQGVPNGPVIFSESFVLSQNKEQEWQRHFNAPDTGKRYLVHIAKQEPQKGKESRVQVNLNGAWVIRDKDFERGEDEFQTTGLLLNNNNSLKLHLKGKSGTRITVTVVEAGEAGTILRRRGWERDRDLTQADRIRNNDTNIFDPNDPASLGGLQPYEGDQISPENQSDIIIGASVANGTLASFVVGQILLDIKAPVDQNSAEILSRYPGQIISQAQIDGRSLAILKLDLAQIPLNNLLDNIRVLNLRENMHPLVDASFSSVNTAKTLSVILDMLTNSSDLVSDASIMNTLSAQQATVSPVIMQEEKNQMITDNSSSGYDTFERKLIPGFPSASNKQQLNSEDFYWLNDSTTKVNRAWNYSMGQNVKVAVIDDEFGYINQYKEFMPGLAPVPVSSSSPSVFAKTRILTDVYLGNSKSILSQIAIGSPGTDCVLNNGKINQTTCEYHDQEIKRNFNFSYPFGYKDSFFDNNPLGFWRFLTPLGTEPSHGLAVSSILGASSDNEWGISGVSPQVQLIPMATKSGADARLSLYLWAQLEQLNRHQNVDIVNISQGRLVNFYDFYFKPNQLALEAGMLYQVIDQLKNKGTIVVVAAGNFGEEVGISLTNPSLNFKTVIPGSFPNCIRVGGYMLENGQIQRWVESSKVPPADGSGSVYSSIDVDIWAPAKNIYALTASNRQDLGMFDTSEKFEEFDGTSHAAPIVAGTLALLKYWKPSLTTDEARSILKDTGTNLTHPSFRGNKPPDQFLIKGLNALAALQDFRIGAKPGRKIRVTAHQAPDVVKDSQGKLFRTYPPYKDINPSVKVGDRLEILGLTTSERSILPTYQVDILQLRKINPAGDLTIQSLPDTSSFGIKALNSGQTVTVQTNQRVGVAVSGNTNNLSALLGGVQTNNLQIQSINNQQVASFQVPQDITTGTHDLTLENETGYLNIENAIQVSSVPPLTIEDLSQVTPYQLPTGIEVYLKQGSREVEVQPDEVIGFAVKENIDLSQLEVEVAGQTFNVQQILHDASSGFKYGSFKLPSNLPPGVQDVIIRLAGTPGVTLEQALKVLLPSRVNIRMSRNILLGTGQEEAEVYITVRDAQGNLVPDGSRFYVRGYPGGEPLGWLPYATHHFFDYSSNSYAYAGYYQGYYGAVFPVQNGRIRFRLGISGAYIDPAALVDPWPLLSSPHFQLRVCNNFSGVSYGCQGDLGPESPAAGIFFVHHIDSINVVSKTPEAGGVRIEMEVKDVLGNPIPAGNVLTFENGGYSQCLIRQDGTSEAGYTRIPVTEPGRISVKWNSNDIACNRSAYFNVLQGNRAGFYLKGSPVLLP